ncbi:MerR family transcriptional regulator, copper efflux regulator [Halopseudomonas formosensis]|jgi:MerR family copper efflux transcriptional regulator|uniref:MerR family transcriptional regulator, copper efflux regulator n=2 Tax=Halopseudomonas formosensis TaxID=1002526 RepID=A0A1I6B309_9GAMM|nr:MerR family transcriptional regulator, copper efflux regulator [Halopseudomonas formosensis]
MMNISQAAAATGLTARMIRHYEKIGLLRDTRRTASGYRLFDEQDIHTLRFIQRARSLGFSIEQIGQLLALWQDRERSSAVVKQLARQHLQELEEKIAGLQAMHASLAELASCCLGDDRPDCPILERLADDQPLPGGTLRAD